jgi:hypothetical protein
MTICQLRSAFGKSHLVAVGNGSILEKSLTFAARRGILDLAQQGRTSVSLSSRRVPSLSRAALIIPTVNGAWSPWRSAPFSGLH